MSKALKDKQEMMLIYETSKDVYDGKYSVQFALLSLHVVRQINRCFSLQIKTDILMLNAA